MAKRKKKAKSWKVITLNKYKIAIGLFTIGFLFFFVKFTAEGSILFSLYALPSYLLFWKIGSNVFYAGLLILTILILFKEELLKKSIFKKFFVLTILICSIINFPVVEWIAKNPDNYWGWISYWFLRIANMLFGWQITAIKWFFVILLFACIVRIYLTSDLKIKAPSFEVNVEEKVENKIDLKAKVKESIKVSKDDSKESSSTEDKNSEDSTLKAVLKQKILEKIQQKEVQKVEKKIQLTFPDDKPTFDINILEPSNWQWYTQIDEQYLLEKAQALKNKLQEFEISIDIDGFNIWPSVIQIRIQPDAGIKISRIENLKNDLSLALKTKSLRVLAPIPWTDTVWVEIPNPKASVIKFKDILWSNEFSNSMSNNLTNLSLWVWIDGKMIVKSLEKMPHLLVAWATGSGKSVWVNNFIMSLIFQNTPAELKFIMVDPKQVELSVYEWIPYLLSPIITEPEKAIKVLKWATLHMDERYQKLKEKKVRNIDEFNEVATPEEKMYRIVIIIDELADLMMTWNKKDTETAITRIAQKARAVWMHLIVATQRPSVNVITGLIKANIPTRVAFTVVSQIDSRTILDMKWAEDLLGKWDMLYIDPTSKFPMRIQSPFVSTNETVKTIESIKEKYMKWISEEEIYHPEIINILTAKADAGWWGWEVDEDDENLVQQAIEIISSTRKASATLLQRKLGIWFARAARIMDILEDRWIVGPQDWAKPREILI